ncbi:uncharacterized protein LY89DRAFT_676167 [Mollisia scopiformis]|uniref:F-box domain-containing protein n=1 Tax=Mollisia scopiformis TaxID=149040 RepID=A0A132BBI8_MOLSC|nr:uncharacterized protein LY89DRAFT_676167 [Mollisia scopiformis]KUJ09369.1 hypothetical protein LY89DRAFT_676167 [Mollisia scopiformis]
MDNASVAVSEDALDISSDEISSKRPLSFDDLPPEIRDQIFANLNESTKYCKFLRKPYFLWDRRLPPLVVALRSLPRSHDHALQWVAKETLRKCYEPKYPSHGRRMPGSKLNKAELASIIGIGVDMSLIVNDPDYRSIDKPAFFHEWLLRMPNLRSVHLYFNFANEVHTSDTEDFLTQFSFWLESCNQLSEVKIELPVYGLSYHKRESLLQGILRRVFKQTGVQAKFIEMVHDDYNGACEYTDAELWHWTAPEGQYMDWTQEIGWKCTKRCSAAKDPTWNFFLEFCRLDFEDERFVIKWQDSTVPNWGFTYHW